MSFALLSAGLDQGCLLRVRFPRIGRFVAADAEAGPRPGALRSPGRVHVGRWLCLIASRNAAYRLRCHSRSGRGPLDIRRVLPISFAAWLAFRLLDRPMTTVELSLAINDGGGGLREREGIEARETRGQTERNNSKRTKQRQTDDAVGRIPGEAGETNGGGWPGCAAGWLAG